jgi:hypothetical protein
MKNNIVKARSRQGTKSMDLTIPVKIIESCNINEGDLFKVSIEEEKEEEIKLTYKRIYKNKK